MPITILRYQYRDASNYKQEGQHRLPGAITDAQKARVMATLEGADQFVPEQVGLPNMRDDMDGSYDDDHRWNEVLGFELSNSSNHHVDDDDPDSIESFVRRMEAASKLGWDAEPRIGWDETIIAWRREIDATGWSQDPDDVPGHYIAVAADATLPLRPIPATGALSYRTPNRNYPTIKTAPFRDITLLTPGNITITGEQVRYWAGRALTLDELARLEEAIPNSSIPDAIAEIVSSFEVEDDARGCSCGMADWGAPGHEGHNSALQQLLDETEGGHHLEVTVHDGVVTGIAVVDEAYDEVAALEGRDLTPQLLTEGLAFYLAHPPTDPIFTAVAWYPHGESNGQD